MFLFLICLTMKILLFSNSTRMMDILGHFLKTEGYCFSRIDGSTPAKTRTQLVDIFNRSKSQYIFLLSTKVRWTDRMNLESILIQATNELGIVCVYFCGFISLLTCRRVAWVSICPPPTLWSSSIRTGMRHGTCKHRIARIDWARRNSAKFTDSLQLELSKVISKLIFEF